MASAFKNKEINWWKVIFVIFTAAYASLILIKPSLGPDNDHMFLRTLQVGKPLFYYNSNFLYFDPIKDGRFMPLGTIEYNLVGLFSKSPSFFWYFFIHALEYILFAVLLVKILAKFTSNKFLIYMTPLLLSLTPGMILSWFPTLGLNERSLMFYFAIFLFSYLQYLEKPKLYYLILGAISANLAIYSKENAFLALGAFAFFNLLFSWKNSRIKINPVRKDEILDPILSKNKKAEPYSSPLQATGHSGRAKIFDGIILFSSISYPVIYFFYVFLPYHAALTYGIAATPLVIALTKNFLNYIFVVDPIITLLVLPLIGWRAYRIIAKREKPQVIYDSLLATVLMFISPLFVINLYGFHYFTPMYLFALPPLFYFIPRIWKEKMIWKILISTAGFLIFFNTLPLSFHFLTYSKYMPINYNKTLDFLVNEIKSKSSDKRVNIFLDGVERCGTQAWVYFNFSEFLLYKGLTAGQFDLKSDRENTPGCDSVIPIKIPVDQFTVFHKGPLPKIAKGDYLIVSPQSTDDIKNSSNKAYLESLNDEYDLIFKTKSMFAFPMLNLKEVMRYFLSVGASPGQKLFGISRKQPNMRWPDFYVFVHK